MIEWITKYRQALGGYEGTKVYLADWIAREMLPRTGRGYILDVCCGLGSVGYRMKRAGRPVAAIDSAMYPFQAAIAVIANNRVRLAKEAVDYLVKRDPKHQDNFAEKNFPGRYLPAYILRGIDTIRWNLHLANQAGWTTKTSRAIALVGLARAIQSAKAHGKFSTRTPASRLHNTGEFMDLFRTLVERINGIVFDNGRKNLAFWGDGPTLVKDTKRWQRLPIAAAYMDPPYYTSRSSPAYWSHFWFQDGVIENWSSVREGEMSIEDFRRMRDVSTPGDVHDLIWDFVDYGRHVPVLAVSYAGEGEPRPTDIRAMMEAQGREVSIVTRSHVRRNVDSSEVLVLGCVAKEVQAEKEKDDLGDRVREALGETPWPEHTVREVTNALTIFEEGDPGPLKQSCRKVGVNP